MTAKERMIEIGEQLMAERKAFDNLRAAAQRFNVVGFTVLNEGLPCHDSRPSEPKGLLPGEFWFWFAGCHYRVRHAFRALGNGMHASAIELDAPLAPEGELIHRSAVLYFDRDGEVEWYAVGLLGPMLKDRPEELLFALLTRTVQLNPAGKVPAPLQEFRERYAG